MSAKAGDKLLDSYEAERRPVGAFNVEWALNAFFNHILLEMGIVEFYPNNLSEVQTPGHVIGAVQALFADSANGRMRRDRLSTIFNTQAIEFYAQDVELGFVYSYPLLSVTDIPAPERPANGQHYTPTSRPGHRLPHCWLDRQGAKLSTHDLIGREGDFVLLVRNKGTQWRTAVEAAAEATGAAIRLVVVARGGDALDAEARWAELSGRCRTARCWSVPTTWWAGEVHRCRRRQMPNSRASCVRCLAARVSRADGGALGERSVRACHADARQGCGHLSQP